MVKLVNDKQNPNSTPKETIEEEKYEESDDENLHLQNYKTDL